MNGDEDELNDESEYEMEDMSMDDIDDVSMDETESETEDVSVDKAKDAPVGNFDLKIPETRTISGVLSAHQNQTTSLRIAFYNDKNSLWESLQGAIVSFHKSLETDPASFSMVRWKAIRSQYSKKIDVFSIKYSAMDGFTPVKGMLFSYLQSANDYYPLNFGSMEDREATYERIRASKRRFLEQALERCKGDCLSSCMKLNAVTNNDYLGPFAADTLKRILSPLGHCPPLPPPSSASMKTAEECHEFNQGVYLAKVLKGVTEHIGFDALRKALGEFDSEFIKDNINIDILEWSYKLNKSPYYVNFSSKYKSEFSKIIGEYSYSIERDIKSINDKLFEVWDNNIIPLFEANWNVLLNNEDMSRLLDSYPIRTDAQHYVVNHMDHMDGI